jgi:hypothetical protein
MKPYAYRSFEEALRLNWACKIGSVKRIYLVQEKPLENVQRGWELTRNQGRGLVRCERPP